MTIGSNENVRAYASLDGNIASGEGNSTVTAIVDRGRADLLIGTFQNAADSRQALLSTGWSRHPKQEE
jgi:hypothetical protein